MQTQAVISSALPGLLNILDSTYNNPYVQMSIKKETCCAVSNITAGNTSHIQQVIQAGLIKPLLELLQTGELDVKKEALWAISNATSGGNHDQIKFLVRQGCIKPLCDLLTCPDPRVVTAALEGLYKILKVAEAEKKAVDGYKYAQMIDDAGGLKKIEDLKSHDNTDEKIVKFLELYWLVRIWEG
ncbi:PREDICTED: importin subunit alpha-6-like [Camelina sativa]|uniref:Importin subunit alpha-6-like n=1 Tax=Camelina sativa TaxID=90675 RepID=A0ABM0XI13_CAMSA|nr:PREDICTED: importin subunit alpha-6-like [Camelina sativa]